MKRKIIVTADDYGMCPSVNSAIEECLAAGTLRATCVMTNMPFCEDAGFLRRRFQKSSIGIHWNLTQGKPILSTSKIPSLVGHDGLFHPFAMFRQRWLLGKINPSQVEAELRAQAIRFHEIVKEVDFWNTHENFHVLPGLFQQCVSLAQQLHLPAMRCHSRFTVVPGNGVLFNFLHPFYWLKGQVISWWSKKAAAQGMNMPAGRISRLEYDAQKKYLLIDGLKSLRWEKVEKALEIVIHPATSIQKELFGSVTESRLAEYKFFREPDLFMFLGRNGFEPVGFEVLKNHHG